MRQYAAIDLKSFYASVECVDRQLDPLSTNLVVADESRTDKTICLAVSPSLKAYGVGGRPRLFEVKQQVEDVFRRTGKKVEFIIAPPRMARYMEVSAKIYQIYLKYVAPEDIHVYSCDEVFMDITSYLKMRKQTAREFTMNIIRDVLSQTGITATAGIGTNLYLCKVAMDIVAKHLPADKDGVRIAELDEMGYRQQLWDHKPLTSFWRIGSGIAARLATMGIYTMGQLARHSLTHEEQLYKVFGVNAELLIDHAWGWEPCTIDYIKAYRPETNSLSSGQVLSCAYTFEKARVVVEEMADNIALDLVDKLLVADQLVLSVGYDMESLKLPDIASKYHGPIAMDHYGRCVPKPSHGSVNLGGFTSSGKAITKAILRLFDAIVNKDLLIRRLNIITNHVIREEVLAQKNQHRVKQLDLFVDYEEEERKERERREELAKERKIQQVLLDIKKQFGKNAILKGINFSEGATARERNMQIGGHAAGDAKQSINKKDKP